VIAFWARDLKLGSNRLKAATFRSPFSNLVAICNPNRLSVACFASGAPSKNGWSGSATSTSAT